MEKLIFPIATVIAEIMTEKKAALAPTRIPPSNNTMSCAMNMSDNVVGQVVNKLKPMGQFALQLDEMTDVGGDAQLLAVSPMAQPV